MNRNKELPINATVMNVLKCWGKTDSKVVDPNIFHPALYHMIDVANVAIILLGTTCSPRWRVNFSRIFNSDDGNINSYLPFFVALHDIGKISDSFQRMNEQQHQRLKNEGFKFGRILDLYHTQVSRNFIRYEWPEDPKWSIDEKNKCLLGEMTAGHHGEFISTGELNSVKLKIKIEEPPIWRQFRKVTFNVLADLFLDYPLSQAPSPQNISAAAMELTGFTTLCDWVGSDQRFFPATPNIDLGSYVEKSRSNALQAINSDGFAGNHISDAPTSFSGLFPTFQQPRPLQLAVDDIPADILKSPSLVIIEAPTGEGKTEAALAVAHRITHQHGFNEFYYALPTMATSNQMHRRVQNHLKNELKLGQIVKLVHGQSFLLKEAVPIEPMSNGTNSFSDTISIDWFNSKKRALLAPFGVGTVDQIELGALNVRHSSLRLAGLSGKVVILDEVHAYDIYMTTIISRLLEWLNSLGASVILLSATLPNNRRKDLLRTYYDGDLDNLPIDYPLMIAASSQNIYTTNMAASQSRGDVSLKFLNFSEDQKTDKAIWFVNQVTNGGVACWITNTVDRSQNLYREVKRIAADDIEVILIHARFPLKQREQLEEIIVNKTGPKKTDRPRKLIVIGTQVLEQSLDLDFDLMVSDLAPIDLILQRAGRLHRHESTVRGAHSSPVLYINTPLNNAQPVITIDKYVYAEYILLRTWETIKDLSKLSLPADYRRLVENVYAQASEDISETLLKAHEKLKRKEEFARQEAMLRLLPEPHPNDMFTSIAARLIFTESETKASWSVAQTRLGEKSLTLIPLEDHGDYCCLPECEKRYRKDAPANRVDQFEMLRSQLRVSHKEVVETLLKQHEALPALFTSSTLLRDVMPLWLQSGTAEVNAGQNSYMIKLDSQLGLTIEKKGG